MNTDSIADLLTRIRNAANARQYKTSVPYSGLKLAILEVMKKHNFIIGFKTVKNKAFNEIEIELNPEKRVLNLKRISKPGQRIYIKKSTIKPVMNNYGIAILSTPHGVMTGEEAIKARTGGEYICQIW